MMENISRFEDFKINEDGAAAAAPAGGDGGDGGGTPAGGGIPGGSSSYPSGGGMGPVVAPQPGDAPGETGTVGSGDLPAKAKKKDKKKYGKKDITGKTIDEKSTMYVTRYTDWVGIGESLDNSDKLKEKYVINTSFIDDFQLDRFFSILDELENMGCFIS